jgi:hypothetical protein
MQGFSGKKISMLCTSAVATRITSPVMALNLISTGMQRVFVGLKALAQMQSGCKWYNIFTTQLPLGGNEKLSSSLTAEPTNQPDVSEPHPLTLRHRYNPSKKN